MPHAKLSDISTETVTHVSHCYGYGGIDLALARIFGGSLRTICACEIEAFAVFNGLAKIEAGKTDGVFPFYSDIKSFPFAEFHGRVSIYSAGFSCQPFSAAGKRLATEDPRHIYPWIADGIAAMRPGVVFLENVEGIISAKCLNQPGAEDGEPVLLYVLRDLEKRGYRATWGIFSASGAGESDVADAAQQHAQGSEHGLLPRADRIDWIPLQHRGGGRVGWSEDGQTQPPLGRSTNGTPYRVDYADLCVSCDSRVDELRLLGNGVVPATAERAFCILAGRLI